MSSSDDSSCCACTDTHAAAAAGECLINCGFAILRGAYAASLLELARDAFEPWFCCERDELRRYLSFSGTGGLRGRGRTHVALPGVLFDANATDQLLFNREVATALVAALPDAMLAFASLIHSAVGASEQATHVDARRDDGVKLHVPLIDVTARRGPLVLEPQRAASGCPTVVATTRLGDAVLYRHSIPHRGTANDDEVNRTALDFSFFPADGVALNDYTRDFLPERVADARAHRVRFAELCAADGLRCAGADAAAAVRQSAGFLGAVPDVGAEGFQGAYRGAGAGRGEWVDPNGSRYVGEMLDGVPHGSGKYVYTSGHVYDGAWVLGKEHGAGLMLDGKGSSYDGEWVQGVRDGRGRAVTKGAGTYDGEWVAGVKVGFGRFVNVDGAVYEGQWQGRTHGRGKYTLANGEVVHDGEWVMGKPVPNERTRLPRDR